MELLTLLASFFFAKNRASVRIRNKKFKQESRNERSCTNQFDGGVTQQNKLLLC